MGVSIYDANHINMLYGTPLRRSHCDACHISMMYMAPL